MAIIVWPDTLPVFANRSDFQRGPGDGRLISPTDLGPGKTRRRYSAVPKPVTASFWMSRYQLARFDAFWDEDTKGGSLPFKMPQIGLHGFPMKDSEGNTLLTAGGQPLLISAWWLVQFSLTEQPYSISSLSDDLWNVAINMEVLP